MKQKHYEQPAIRAYEAAMQGPSERALQPVPDKRVIVKRSWPGVRVGQEVHLHPMHEARLIKGGFVELR